MTENDRDQNPAKRNDKIPDTSKSDRWVGDPYLSTTMYNAWSPPILGRERYDEQIKRGWMALYNGSLMLYSLYKLESKQEIRRDDYNFAVAALTTLAALVGEMNGLLETRFAITKDRPIRELIHTASQLVPKTLTLTALHNENDSSGPIF